MLEDVTEEIESKKEDESPDIDLGLDQDVGLESGLEYDTYWPKPFWLKVSGLYRKKTYQISPKKPPPYTPLPYNSKVRMELRLDVDGRYPQMTASGVIVPSWFLKRTHWIADLKKVQKYRNRWKGNIWHIEGDTRLFPFDTVEIYARRSIYSGDSYAEVTFHGYRGKSETYRLDYVSPYFHDVEFEYDVVTGSDIFTHYNSHDHPNHPADLPSETLSIETVYRRAGFNVSKSGDDETIPIDIAGADNVWNDLELHDAMQMYWSRFDNIAQWSMWTLFAGEYNLGWAGVMFDDIGPNHRQGCTIFSANSLFDAEPGDPDPIAFRQRYIFWCACHEMGHCFNLAHSFQKELGDPWCGRVQDEDDALSVMNYPFYYPVGWSNSSGTDAYFADFRWRFSDQELLFLRHAPERFVQMGNADWFDDHGFKYANTSTRPDLALELRVNRKMPVFEFLETVAIEFKLANVSSDPNIVDSSALKSQDQFVVIIKKDGKPARQFIPFMTAEIPTTKKVLQPKEALYEAHLISVGRNGWDLSEPGIYTIHAVLRLANGEDLVSNPLKLKILPPRGYDEEHLAQDYFSEDVGRVLAFEGSAVLHQANDVLKSLVDEFPRHRASVLARYAIFNPVATNLKELHIPDDIDPKMPLAEQGVVFRMYEARYDEAKDVLDAALNKKIDDVADTLGHIRYRKFVQKYAHSAALAGDTATADTVINRLHSTLKKRNVLPAVLEEIKSFGRALQK